MPRSLRIEYPGAIYHVMNRGDRREPIFLDDVDQEKFLTTLTEACTKTIWRGHAFRVIHNLQPESSLRLPRLRELIL